MRPLKNSLFIAFLNFVVFTTGIAEDEKLPAELTRISLQFEKELESLNKPLHDLNEKYRQYLSDQKEEYQAAGRLEPMLAVEEEMKQFEKEGENNALSTLPKLSRLQKIYRRQRSELLEKSDPQKLALASEFHQLCSELAAKWTREGKIAEAKLALAQSKQFAKFGEDTASMNPVKTGLGEKAAVAETKNSVDEREAGEEMQNSLGMKMVWIPPGKFRMGDDGERTELTEGYWIGKYEVTQEEYERLTGLNPSNPRFQGKLKPVISVSWQTALDFAKKLTEREMANQTLPKGWSYSLPTEAQWEYACRAGEDEDFSGGTVNEVAWFSENTAKHDLQEVGKKNSNPWGLHDMHGNLFEFCLDWFTENLEGGKDPVGPTSGEQRVIRGGSHGSPSGGCRSSSRAGSDGNSSNVVGFRLVLIPSDSAP